MVREKVAGMNWKKKDEIGRSEDLNVLILYKIIGEVSLIILACQKC